MPTPVRSGGGASLPSVEVAYYRRMKLQRVYPWVVRWRKGAAPAAGEKVTLRLLMAGAQVLPSEQTLDAGNPNAQATFYVTPLARGWLRAQRLEIVHNGRKVQEVPLASKATTHRLTWALLLLTVLVPWFINAYVKHSPFVDRPTYDLTTGAKILQLNPTVAQTVENSLASNVPEMPALINDNLPQVNDTLIETRRQAAEGYVILIQESQHQPLAFYAGLIFFVLALVSAVAHRDARRTRASKSISLSSAARSPEDAEAATA